MKEELVKLHHERSSKDFPELRLEENEFVELAIQRSGLGIALIWGSAIFGYILLAVVAIIIGFSPLDFSMTGFAKSYIYLIILILVGIITIAALVASKVYRANRLYVTNRRIIYHQADSLFSKSVAVIELVSIEDVSFSQENITDHIFHLGTIRMSTVSEENDYIFKYVNTPRDELDTITHLVHMEKERTKRNRALADEPNIPSQLIDPMPIEED
ncbi:PH domain-containing protein [Candidatus Saccharibacteria bacterium]|nr:PH domain-containing protein [Candidatus Saccharibacteria bacterium]